MHKPASKAASHITLRRLEKHELALDALLILHLIVRLTIASNKDNLVVFAVRIRREAVKLCAALFLFPVLDELAHLAFEIHEQTLCAARALELLAQLLGHNAGCRGLASYRLGRGFLDVDGDFALDLLASQAGIPERREVVWDMLNAVGGMYLPVAGRWGLGVWVVQQAIYSLSVSPPAFE